MGVFGGQKIFTIFAIPIQARMAELVDALVSKTSGLSPCRFDPGSGYKGR
jgi:hypothetical protein